MGSRLGPYRDWEMTSSYLQQPLVPFAVALSQMLENIEADLADGKLGTVQAERLWAEPAPRGCSRAGQANPNKT